MSVRTSSESDVYDYVVVGGGSAGCVLAARLSENPLIKVCLLEAGPVDSHPMIRMPLGIAYMMRSKKLNWNFHTEAEPTLANRRLFWPRGKMLGGSSSSNAMCYTRGHASDYDEWARLGNVGWSYQDVLPYFRRAEHHERGADAFHGTGGPLNVANLRSPNVLTSAFVTAGTQVGIPRNDDFNGAEQEGVGIFQVTQKNGRRCSTASGYLGMAKRRRNLTIITGAQARRVVFRGDTAVGVEYQRGGKLHVVHAAMEVILSAGAIQSPQILMLSGIGDRVQLQAHGIHAVAHLPGVGKNLRDHLDVIVVNSCTQPVSIGITPGNVLRWPWELIRYFCGRRGLFTSNAAEGGGFVKSRPDEAVPDLQFHFSPLKLSRHGLDMDYLYGDGYSLHVCCLRPKSVGEIRLASANPLEAPQIIANYLTHPDDMETMVRGVQLARLVLAAPAFDGYRGRELMPTVLCEGGDKIRQFIRERAETIYHPVGTCKMGQDAMAVVDSQLRVHGVRQLRVVDASIMPTLIGGNTNAPTVMIAEKASELIKQAWYESTTPAEVALA